MRLSDASRLRPALRRRGDEWPSEGIPPVHHRTRVVCAHLRPGAVLLGVRGGNRPESREDDAPVSAPAGGLRVVARAAVVLHVGMSVHVRVGDVVARLVP